VFAAGWHQEGHPTTETLHAPISPSFSTRDIAGKTTVSIFVVRVVEWPSSRGRIVDVTNALRLNFADGAIAFVAIVIVPFAFFIRTHRYATTCVLKIRMPNDPVLEVHRMLDDSAVRQGHLPLKQPVR